MLHRALRRLVAGAALAAAAVAVTARPAFAHAELLSSEPGYGDLLTSPPKAAVFAFSEPMELRGARLSIQSERGRAQALAAPTFGSDARRTVDVDLPTLSPGSYTLTWFFLGNDGHVMGGEIVFRLGGAPPASPSAAPAPAPRPVAVPPSPGPGAAGVVPRPAGPRPRFGAVALAVPEAVVRVVDYASLAVLIGGTFFVACLWNEGARQRRVRRLLWAALAGSLTATFLTFGLTAAGLQGLGTADALRLSVITGVSGTHFAQVLTVRGAFLLSGVLVLGVLAVGGEQAARSRVWRLAAAVAGLAVLVTHSQLGHASEEGLTAQAADLIHLVAVTVWLGGLVVLTTMVLPRRRPDELSSVLPRFSAVAFAAVATMVMAGAVMLSRIVPSLGDLPTTPYGRLLLVKLGVVGLLLLAAQQARSFTNRRLVRGLVVVGAEATGDDPAPPQPLQPLLLAVGVELSLAFAILAATAFLVGTVAPLR
jgi:putative copper export protein/methionine-rich copper-binding protein CopC